MRYFKKTFYLALLSAALVIHAPDVSAQTANGKATTAQPTYTNNGAFPLSLTTDGLLRTTVLAPISVDDFYAQGSTTAGQVGPLIQGAVTTNAPTYADGDTQPLSLNEDGELRIAGAISAETECFATAVPPEYEEGTNNPISCDLEGQTRISGTINAASTATATAADPAYDEGVSEPFSQTLDGYLRTTLLTPIPAGTNNIGDVDVASLPSIPAGTNNIGDVDVASLPAIPAGNNNIGDVDAIQSGTWNIATVTAVTAISNALPAGNNNIGDVDVASLPALPAGNNNIGDVDVASLPALADQGTSNYSLIVTNSTSATNVKSSAGTLYEISLYNNSSTIAYLKLYNSASAPTCGAGTPVARYLIPGAASGGAGSNVTIPLGKTFGTGIGFCITTGIADADTAAPAASTYLINLTYK